MRDTFRKAPKRFEFGLVDDEFTGTPYATESDARRAIELDDADQELGQGGGFATYQAELSPPVYRGTDAPSSVEVIRLREQATPPTAREVERRAAFEARDLMSPSQRAASAREFRRIQDPNDTSSVSLGEMRRDMIGSEAYDAIDPFIPDVVSDFEYDPQALAYETVPFSDEMIGAGIAATTDRPLGASLRRTETDRERARLASPGSAFVGMTAQGALLAPALARATGSSVAPSIWNATRGGALQGIKEGAVFGGLQAADASQAHVMDDLAVMGDAIRMQDRERFINAGTAGLSDANTLATDTARGTGYGALLGGTIGGATGLGGALVRRGATRGGVQAASAAEADRLARVSAEQPIDETLLDDYLFGGTPNEEGNIVGVLSDSDVIGPASLDVTRVAPVEAERQGFSLGRLAREPFVEDPNLAAMRAVGMQSQRQLRGADRAFGADRFARNLDRFGIRPFGEVGDQEMFRLRAAQLGEQTRDALQSVYADMAARGVEPNVANLERGLMDLAERYNVPGASNEAARAEVLGELASLREHMPTDIGNLSVDDAGNLFRPSEATPDVLVPRLSMPQFMGARRGAQAAVQDVYRGSVTNPTTRHSVRREMARLNTEALDQAISETYGPEALAQLRLVREANATARAVAPSGDLAFGQQTTPTIRRLGGASTGATIGTSLGGLPGGVVGGIAGYGLGSRAPRYEWSILATLNERQHGSIMEAVGDITGQLGRRIQGIPEYAGAQSVDDIARVAAQTGDAQTSRLAAMSRAARSVPVWIRNIRDQIGVDPSFFGRRGQELAAASAAGDMALMSYIQRLPNEDPETAAALESLAPGAEEIPLPQTDPVTGAFTDVDAGADDDEEYLPRVDPVTDEFIDAPTEDDPTRRSR